MQMYENWANDPAVTRLVFALGTAQKALRWDQGTQALAWAAALSEPDYYQWAIVEKATGQVFGSISIYTTPCWVSRSKGQKWPGLELSGGIWEPGYCIRQSSVVGQRALPPKHRKLW